MSSRLFLQSINVNLIINAMDMPSEKVLNIQNNLESFYNDQLSPGSFLRKFENRNNNEIIACNDVESLQWL